MTGMQSIALDRFGLGARPDDSARHEVGDDPRQWLLRQFDRFDPSPAIIAQQPSAAEMTARQIAYRAERRAMRNAPEEAAAIAAEPADLPSRRQLRAAYLQGADARRRRDNAAELGLNENLAREILELHTLGVRTGYTQADVTEFARALTGWTVAGFTRGAIARRLAGAGRGSALRGPRSGPDHAFCAIADRAEPALRIDPARLSAAFSASDT